jgi:ATP-dependent Lon protease
LTENNTVLMRRIEISRMSGSGKLRITGEPSRLERISLVTAFDYARANKRTLGIEADIDADDFHVQLVDLSHSKDATEIGVAFFVALYSLIRNKSVLPSLVIMGDMTIQGNIMPIHSLIEPLRVIMDNGAKRVLIPINSRRLFLEVSPDVLEKVDPIFYSDSLSASLKALGMG